MASENTLALPPDLAPGELIEPRKGTGWLAKELSHMTDEDVACLVITLGRRFFKAMGVEQVIFGEGGKMALSRVASSKGWHAKDAATRVVMDLRERAR